MKHKHDRGTIYYRYCNKLGRLPRKWRIYITWRVICAINIDQKYIVYKYRATCNAGPYSFGTNIDNLFRSSLSPQLSLTFRSVISLIKSLKDNCFLSEDFFRNKSHFFSFCEGLKLEFFVLIFFKRS